MTVMDTFICTVTVLSNENHTIMRTTIQKIIFNPLVLFVCRQSFSSKKNYVIFSIFRVFIVLNYIYTLVIIYLGPSGCVFTYEWLHWFEGQWRISKMGIASLKV